MPLQKITLKSGCNRENTRYTTDGGWYETDKVRFRQGTPEKIGGWLQKSAATFLGICRSLNNWITLDSLNLIGVGTNLKFYIERGGIYLDITPLRTYTYSTTLTNPFTTSLASALVLVTDAAHGAQAGDLVTFSSAAATGGIPAAELNQQHVIVAPVTTNTYYILATTLATSAVTGGGAVAAAYIIDAITLLSNPFATVNGSTTITVTDGIAMGHQGMKASLVSREVIADSVELTMRGHCYDALVGLAGCDKSLPGLMMAMVRLNVPSVFIYGGSILPGQYNGRDVTVVDVLVV